MVAEPTNRTALPASNSRVTGVTERTSSNSAPSRSARVSVRPSTRRTSPKRSKGSRPGMFSSAMIFMK